MFPSVLHRTGKGSAAELTCGLLSLIYIEDIECSASNGRVSEAL